MYHRINNIAMQPNFVNPQSFINSKKKKKTNVDLLDSKNTPKPTFDNFFKSFLFKKSVYPFSKVHKVTLQKKKTKKKAFARKTIVLETTPEQRVSNLFFHKKSMSIQYSKTLVKNTCRKRSLNKRGVPSLCSENRKQGFVVDRTPTQATNRNHVN